jgi:hypothetical protein
MLLPALAGGTARNLVLHQHLLPVQPQQQHQAQRQDLHLHHDLVLRRGHARSLIDEKQTHYSQSEFALFDQASGLRSCSMFDGNRSAAGFCSFGSASSAKNTDLAERVTYQRAIEEVYWRHRIWPRKGGERPDPKPSLDAVMSQAQLEEKVVDYLRKSQALEDYWQHPITAEQLQAEMDRMGQRTRQPEVLRELFEALGNDPFVVAECLARPVLAERLVIDLSAQETGSRFEFARTKRLHSVPITTTVANGTYNLPPISEGDPPCTDDTWTATSTTNAPSARASHTAVWTGSEMIIWGRREGNLALDTGGRYDPSTDNWTDTTTANAPTGRGFHTAVWTGTDMIVWGGFGDATFNTGGKYNPGANSWTATNTTNAPTARDSHTAVWTGDEMVVWGGEDANLVVLNTGGRYNPNTDNWTATSTTNAPDARSGHTAVWTGSEMIAWGGHDENFFLFDTGGRYNPSTNSWIATSTTNAPFGRARHTAVWTGSEMIVWGGLAVTGFPTTPRTPGEDSIRARTVGQPLAPPTRLMRDSFTRRFGRGVKT